MKVISIHQPWAYLASVGLFRPSIPVESRDIRNKNNEYLIYAPNMADEFDDIHSPDIVGLSGVFSLLLENAEKLGALEEPMAKRENAIIGLLKVSLPSSTHFLPENEVCYVPCKSAKSFSTYSAIHCKERPYDFDLSEDEARHFSNTSEQYISRKGNTLSVNLSEKEFNRLSRLSSKGKFYLYLISPVVEATCEILNDGLQAYPIDILEVSHANEYLYFKVNDIELSELTDNEGKPLQYDEDKYSNCVISKIIYEITPLHLDKSINSTSSAIVNLLQELNFPIGFQLLEDKHMDIITAENRDYQGLDIRYKFEVDYYSAVSFEIYSTNLYAITSDKKLLPLLLYMNEANAKSSYFWLSYDKRTCTMRLKGTIPIVDEESSPVAIAKIVKDAINTLCQHTLKVKEKFKL